MKHAEILAIPVGAQIVVSERATAITRANLSNSVVAVLESHDNYASAHWSGLYWRPMTDNFDHLKADPKARTKNYLVTTEIRNSDGTTTKVKTLLAGKYVLGQYNSETQKMWEDARLAREASEVENSRLQEVTREAGARGERESEARRISVRDLVESVLGRKIDPDSRELSVGISCRDTRFTDEARTHAEPVLSGTVNIEFQVFEELIEKMYAQLDAR